MIVPMKKITVITIASRAAAAVETLGRLGVLHVHTDQAAGDRIEALREQYQRLERAAALLPEEGAATGVGKSAETATQAELDLPDLDLKSGSPHGVDHALRVAEYILQQGERRSNLRDQLERVRREQERLAPWGQVDPQLIESLQEAGVAVRLYQLSPDQAETLQAAHRIELYRDKSIVRLVAVATPGTDLPAEPAWVQLGTESTLQLAARAAEIDHELALVTARLAALVSARETLDEARVDLTGTLRAAQVGSVMESDEHLKWLTGFAPSSETTALEAAARTEGWALLIQDPSEEDHVPTKVKNSKAIRIIQPVFDLLGTVPGYRELDISFWFLLFFTIFFAMILGDGGYGLVLLAGSIYAVSKAKRNKKPIGDGLILMTVLSSATVIWGALTGTWFAYQPIAELPVLRSLVIPGLASINPTSTKNIQLLCFVLGTVHLSIAHIWNFVRGVRSGAGLGAVAQLGWLSMVLGLYYLVLQLVLDPAAYPMPDYAMVMIGGGLAAVLLFSAQEKGQNFFVGVAKGFAGIITTALDSISAFSDIISYIRLFAVGLASLAIAQSFNTMALGIGASVGGVGGAVAAGLVLFMGHTLNLAMGALSVIVHGVRLNMLEFSGHLGMEWTGVAYAPFNLASSKRRNA